MQTDPIGYEDQINLYAYVGNDPMNATDPTGMELEAVELMGLNSSDTELKSRTYYVDKKIAGNIKGFVTAATKKFKSLSVNNTFRVKNSSEIKTNNTKAKGLSRHQAGFAIDLNGTSKLSEKQMKELHEIAKNNGLGPLNDWKKDKPHFSANPAEHGYKSLDEAVEVNKADYQAKTSKNSDNGMSGAGVKICSGMGAQKGGCK